MGRPQGDQLPKDPVIFVGKVNGEVVERPAYSPADEANWAARGWVRKSERRGGKQADVPEVASGSPRVEDAAGSSNG
jgi:hypothetical protein